MIWESRWVVLVPGNAGWVEKRARELLEELDDRLDYRFTVIRGQGRYHAVVESGPETNEMHWLLGDAFSRELDELVYAIEGREEHPEIRGFMKGEEKDIRRDPEEFVRSLGCILPWFDQPPPNRLASLLKAVTLIQGVSVAKIQEALEKEAGRPLPPGYYHMEETPQGVLLTDGSAPWIFSDAYLGRRFPRATVYTVITDPNLSFFAVSIMHKRKTVKFMPPPDRPSIFPAIDEVMGERTPERILSAMGIPKEWFRR